MAVDMMMGFGDSAADGFPAARLEDAASDGIESVEKLLRLLSNQYQPENCSGPSGSDSDIGAAAGAAVNKFKKVISLLDRTRTGHARFRKAPLGPPEPAKAGPIPKTEQPSAFRVYRPNPVQRPGSAVPRTGSAAERKESTTTITFSASPSSFVSSLTGDTDSVQPSMSSGFQFSHSAGKPPLSAKRKCNDAVLRCASSSSRCHCSKKRKSITKRTIRVPAISMKMADIPADDFSWRKYGQKPIKGSPHPRGYYKCSSVRGCPARKHVERALDDPAMLIVTYESDHSHSDPVPETSLKVNGSNGDKSN